MNFHLIMVHFPIALLTFYAFLEIFSFKRVQALPYWWYAKAIIVVAGSLSSFATLQTGLWIEPEFQFSRDVVEIHSFWAYITAIIFAILAISYLIGWISRAFPLALERQTKILPVWNVLMGIQQFVLNRYVSFVLAFGGLIAVTITGALGGAISQGPDIDPVVHFVYHLLIKK